MEQREAGADTSAEAADTDTSAPRQAAAEARTASTWALADTLADAKSEVVRLSEREAALAEALAEEQESNRRLRRVLLRAGAATSPSKSASGAKSEDGHGDEAARPPESPLRAAATAEADHSKHRERVLALCSTIATLKSDAARSEAVLQSSQEKASVAVRLLQDECGALRKRVARLKTKLGATQQAEQTMQEHARRVQTALEKLQESEATAVARAQDAEARASEASTRCTEAEAALDASRRAGAKAEREAEDLRQTAKLAAADRAKSEAAVSKLEAQLEEKLSRWTDFTKRYQELQARLDGLASRKDSEIARLKEQAEAARTDAARHKKAAVQASERDRRTIQRLRARLVRGGGGPGLRGLAAGPPSPGRRLLRGPTGGQGPVPAWGGLHTDARARAPSGPGSVASMVELARSPAASPGRSLPLPAQVGPSVPAGEAAATAREDGSALRPPAEDAAGEQASARDIAGAVATAIESASRKTGAELAAARAELRDERAAVSRLREDVEDARAEIARLETVRGTMKADAAEAAEASRREVAALVEACEGHVSRAKEAEDVSQELRRQLHAATTALSLAAGASWEGADDGRPASSAAEEASRPALAGGSAAPDVAALPGVPSGASVADIVRTSSRTVALLSAALRESEAARSAAEAQLARSGGSHGAAPADIARLERDKRVLVDSAKAQSRVLSRLRSRVRELERIMATANAASATRAGRSVVEPTHSRRHEGHGGRATTPRSSHARRPFESIRGRDLSSASSHSTGSLSGDGRGEAWPRAQPDDGGLRISELETHCTHLIEERSDLKRRCDRLSEQLRESRAEYAALLDTVRIAEQERGVAQAEAREAQEASRAAARRADAARAAADSSEAQAAMHRDESAALQKRVDAARDEAAAAQGELSRALARSEREREAAQAAAREREQDAATAEARLAAARHAADHAATAGVSPGAAGLLDLAALPRPGPSAPAAPGAPSAAPGRNSAEHAIARSEAEALKASLAAARAERDDLLAKLSAVRSECLELRQALSRARREASEAREAAGASSRRHERVKELSRSLTLQLRSRLLQAAESEKQQASLASAAKREAARADALETSLQQAQEGADEALAGRLRSALGRLNEARGQLAASFRDALGSERRSMQAKLDAQASEIDALRARCDEQANENESLRSRVGMLQSQARALIRAAEAAGAGLMGVPEPHGGGTEASLARALESAAPSPERAGRPRDGGVWRDQARRSRAQLEVAVSHARVAREEASALRAALTAVRTEMMAALRAEVGMLAQSASSPGARPRQEGPPADAPQQGPDGTFALEGPASGAPALGSRRSEQLLSSPVPVPSLGQVPLLGRSLAQRELWARDTSARIAEP